MTNFVKLLWNWFLTALPSRPAIIVEFLAYHHRLPRLHPPRTFCEKIVLRKIQDHDPRMPVLVDKILAKREVARLLGPEWLIPTLWSGDQLPPRSERNWPIPYVLKGSHGSGWNLFVLSEADQNWDRIEASARRWLNSTHARHAHEWLYTRVQPGLLVEPFMGVAGVAPPDYKFLVFDGRTAYIQVDLGRMQTHRQLFYDTHWNRQKFEYLCPWTNEEVPPPRSLPQMIAAANLLGAGFSFVRVDLYEIEGRPYFGEMTFYPNSGRYAFKPESVELELGRLWPDEAASVPASGALPDRK